MKKKARKYGVEFELVAAIVWQESKGNPWATRVEPGFYKRYLQDKDLIGHIPTTISLETERWHRATSWGLMQMMGETMREKGYKKDDLTRLLIPAINLEYGCRHLKHLIQKAAGVSRHEQIKKALSAWNTGRMTHENTQYDELVLGHIFKGTYNEMWD